MFPNGTAAEDFLSPAGEPALAAADSVSWRVFGNPLSVFVGGVAAVLLELAEPAVRAGVWEHTRFRTEPLERMRRTGFAAMLTVYGPRSRAEALIGTVNGRHERVQGVDATGRSYRASDPALLEWVHATASFGFLQAYEDWVAPFPPSDRDRFYAEGAPIAALYGARAVPRTATELDALLARMAPRLEPSGILIEFLETVLRMPALAVPLRPFQRLLVKAAVETLPPALRDRLELGARWELTGWQRGVVRRAGRIVDRVVLHGGPVALSCRRLGLPVDHLHRSS